MKEDNLLAFENEMIKQYIKDNDLTVSETVCLHEGATDTIAFIVKTKENSSGELIQPTDSVTVWAEGRILDEYNTSLRQFMKMDSDDEVKWFLPNMIKGISLTLPKLKVGEEAIILFSSGMGYSLSLIHIFVPGGGGRHRDRFYRGEYRHACRLDGTGDEYHARM